MLLGSRELVQDMIISLQRLGVEVIAVDRYSNAPGHQVEHRSHVINMGDDAALEALIAQEKPDLIMPEIKAIAIETLVVLEAAGTVTMIPTACATRLTMNYEGIRRLAGATLALATLPYHFANNLAELKAACAEIGFPCVIKPVMSPSDKGQSKIDSADEVEATWTYSAADGRVDSGRIIVEGFIDFDDEITLMTVRALQPDGSITTDLYKPIGHLQVQDDYVESWQPHPMHPDAPLKARDIAKKVTNNPDSLGLFGVRLFVKHDMAWFFEVSPRPHDTGMVTIVIQQQSEFELHAKVILGLLVNVALRNPPASTVIYGQHDAKGMTFEGVTDAMHGPDIEIRLFGKPKSFARQRMGWHWPARMMSRPLARGRNRPQPRSNR